MWNKIIDKILIFIFVFFIIFFSYREGYTILPKIVGSSLIILFSIRGFFLKSKIKIPSEYLIVAVWLLFTLITGVFATNFETFSRMYVTVLQVTIISFVIYNLLTWMDNPQFLYLSVYWATMAMTIFVDLNPTAYSIGGRLEGTLGNSNLYGFALLISAMFAINQIFESRHVFKIFYLATVPFLLHMIIETGSRKAMISVAIFIIVYTAFKFKYEIFKRPIMAIMSVIILLSAGVYMASYMEHTKQYKRLAEFFETVETRDINKADESTYYRYMFYKRGLKIVAEHPVFGVGLDNFRNESYGLTNTRTGTYAHSNYIELLADTGILGFIIYCSIYFTILIRIARLRIKDITESQKGLYLLATSSIIIYILYDFAMVSYYEKFSWLILTFIITATLLLKDNMSTKEIATLQDMNSLVRA